MAKNNAQIAQQNATYAIEAGKSKQQQEGLKSAEELGQVKTALAANNVDVNTGSAKEVEVGQREKGALSQETIANNAELQAYGYESQATGFEAQAGLEQATAAEAPLGAAIGAGGSLLSNASALSLKWNPPSGASANPWALDTGTVAGA